MPEPTADVRVRGGCRRPAPGCPGQEGCPSCALTKCPSCAREPRHLPDGSTTLLRAHPPAESTERWWCMGSWGRGGRRREGSCICTHCQPLSLGSQPLSGWGGVLLPAGCSWQILLAPGSCRTEPCSRVGRDRSKRLGKADPPPRHTGTDRVLLPGPGAPQLPGAQLPLPPGGCSARSTPCPPCTSRATEEVFIPAAEAAAHRKS